ncbi:MAG: hypothetical protein ACX93U_13870 [Salipiger thiooxidans]|uniref:hypothetical protein n=1 Tax=Salipiger thiooxidans TaxID=282683 RepID=UPI001CFA93B0|nr:hypothetical protein [Salipiger thiooxidans]
MLFTPCEAPVRPALGLLLAHLRRAGRNLRTIDDVSQAVSPMWPEVTEWVELVDPRLNRVLDAVTAVADPECIVLGGQIPRPLAQAFVDRAVFLAGSPPRPHQPAARARDLDAGRRHARHRCRLPAAPRAGLLSRGARPATGLTSPGSCR